MREDAGSDSSVVSVASTTASGVLISSTSVHMAASLSKRTAGPRNRMTPEKGQKAADSSYGGTDGGDLAIPSQSPPETSSRGSLRKTHHGMKDMEAPSQALSRQNGLDGGQLDPTGMSPQDGERNMVHISVKHLREIPAPLPDFTVKKKDPTYIPPALPANKYPPATFNHIVGPTDAVSCLAIQKNETSKMGPKSPKFAVLKHFQEVPDKHGMKTVQEDCKPTNKDVQISQFSTGQKETLLAALNKRVQSGPVTKEVRVHLLNDAANKNKPPFSSADRNCSEVHSATIAAATAAAIAAAGPVFKAQSDLEAQINSVSQLLIKLRETDRHFQQLTEKQSKIQSHSTQMPHQQERVSELERQLGLLTEQRLQHLEKLQQQQLEMQSHFISSAMKTSSIPPQAFAPMCTHLHHAAPKPQPVHQPLHAAPPRISSNVADWPLMDMTTDSGKSPLETPAPRRFAPKPLDVQPPPKVIVGKENVEEPKNHRNAGKVHFLQQVLGHDGISQSESAFRTHTPLNLTAVDDSFLQNERTGAVRNAKIAPSNAVQKADDVLQDLTALKKDMQSMMKDAKLWTSQTKELKSSVPRSMTCTSVHVPPVFHRSNVSSPKSTFEDAERILREVQSNRKVLDENLEAIIRAKDGAAMYSLISALATNSSGAEEIRIQKTVDSWIAEITSEIEDELARKEVKKKRPEEKVQEPTLRRTTGIPKDMKRCGEIRAPARSMLRGTKHSAGVPAKVPCKHSAGRPMGSQSLTLPKKDARLKEDQKVDDSSMMVDEEVLNRVYGIPVYQGHRSTLKKGPYLRFSSPSPKSKPRRPKLLETVKGVKVKSTKVQTTSHVIERPVAKLKPPELSVAKDYEPQYVFTPSADPGTSSVPMEGHLIPMAIPLGRSRFDTSAPLPSAVILSRPQPVTVQLSLPPESPKTNEKVEKPNIAIVEMKSEKKDRPQLAVQVLPCLDIDSIVSDSSSTSQSAPSVENPPLTPSPVKPDIQLPENVETEEEILALPGSSFQDTDIQDDELIEVPEPLLELDGWAETISPQQGGIPFPLPAPAPQAATDILDGIIQRKESLENRLVNWVEQEIMARVISEMQTVRRDLVPDVTTSSSPRSEMSSDIVEAAGGEGLQLFVDAGIPVDSSLIRKYVNEALAETIAIMLGERETRGAPASHPRQPEMQHDPVEVAVVPTPRSTPPTSPLPEAREPSIVKTPEMSPQASIEEHELLHDQPDDSGQRSIPVHADTPTVTPVPSPHRVASPSPVLLEEAEVPSVIQTSPTTPWGHLDLPLEEENPHSVIEPVEYKDVMVMTVAADEEPNSIIQAGSSQPVLPRRTPSPVPSTAVSAPSSDESSLTVTVTETDTTDKPISEGEIVYSFGQIAAAQALAEGGVVYPHVTDSLSSTLKDAHDMEFDPPSEGQVIQGPHRGAHLDPVLSLLVTCHQDLVAPQEAFYHRESSGEDSSMGEISEGQRPRLTMAAEQVLVGHSVLMDRPSNAGQTAVLPLERPSSPGQYIIIPGESDNVSSGPMSIRDLDSQLLSGYHPHADHVARDAFQGPKQQCRPVTARLIQVGVKSAEVPHQAPEATQEDTDRTLVEPSTYLTEFSGEAARPFKNMAVTLPTTSEVKEESRSLFDDSDSSGADTF